MGKSFKCVVIRPGTSKSKSTPLPTVYLLHGWSGNYSNWISKVPALKKYADEYQLLIVCPDGHYSSWYFDSPIDSTMRYETYVALEVPAWIDAHYSTIKNRHHGGVELYSSRNRFDIIKRIGDTIMFADNWSTYSVTKVVEKYPLDSIAIIIDCGTEDFFYSINHALHEKMLKLKIPHDYIERPGKHDWNYWANAVKYQLLYFRSYFDSVLRQVMIFL